MPDNRIKTFSISPKVSIKDAMRQMSLAGEKILFVVDEESHLLGSLTDGDIRRWVLKEGSLTAPLKEIYNNSPIYVESDYKIDKIKKLMIKSRIDGVPVVNSQKQLSDVLLWGQVFGNGHTRPRSTIDVPVVIMAGGKGTRLDPFTRVLPKPLIPIGDKTVLELIMDKFHEFGVKEFYLSVHYKSRMIKAYFDEVNSPYKIGYIEEDKPLGTVGGIKILEGKIDGDFMISNCDILIEGDYREILDFHRKKNYDITMVGSFRHFTIPYGVCTIESGGRLLSIKEKPEYDFLVNTGMYVLKSKTLSLIPEGTHFDVTDLVEKVKEQGGKVGVFPIDEKSWIDIGQWDEYQKSLRDHNLI